MVAPVVTAALINQGANLLNSLIGTNNSQTTNTSGTSSTNATSSTQASGTTAAGSTRRLRTVDSGNTVTTQAAIDEDTLVGVAQRMLEGNDGLAAILGIEQGAGMYGSTNAGLLTNDLMSRIVTEVGRLSAATTVTDSGRETEMEDDQLALTTTRSQQNTEAQQQTQTQQTQNTQSSSRRRCFITTAVCEKYGRPDNCKELETLRKFRDTWMLKNHPKAVHLYYHLAPKIVDYINSRPNAQEIYEYLMHAYISVAVDYIKHKDYERAYDSYAQMVLTCLIIAKAKE